MQETTREVAAYFQGARESRRMESTSLEFALQQ